MERTNCPNCGAVMEPAETRCPYCGTPYPRPKREKVAVAVATPMLTQNERVNIELDPKLLARLQILDEEMQRGIMTPNEARRLMGLREL